MSGRKVEEVMDVQKFDPGILFPVLRFGIYRVVYRIEGKNRLHGYLGSAWRGILGHALRKKFCLWPHKSECERCSVRSGCVYYRIFALQEEASRLNKPPRPYMVTPSGINSKQVSVDITLLGLDDGKILQVLSALYDVKAIGWAGKKTWVRLDSIQQMQPDRSWRKILSKDKASAFSTTSWLLKDYLDKRELEPPPWTVKIVTPMRLERKKKVLTDIPWDWTFERFAWNLFDRCYPDGRGIRKEVFTNDLPAFFKDPGKIIEVSYWHDMHRFSSTQKKRIPTGGLKGVGLIIPPEGREDIWFRWWHSAALLHLGKKTTIGNGLIAFNHLTGDNS